MLAANKERQCYERGGATDMLQAHAGRAVYRNPLVLTQQGLGFARGVEIES